MRELISDIIAQIASLPEKQVDYIYIKVNRFNSFMLFTKNKRMVFRLKGIKYAR